VSPAFINSRQAKEEEAAQAAKDNDEYVQALLDVNGALLDRIAALQQTLAKAYSIIRDLELEKTMLLLQIDRTGKVVNAGNTADG
jgi:hypothetical protein